MVYVMSARGNSLTSQNLYVASRTESLRIVRTMALPIEGEAIVLTSESPCAKVFRYLTTLMMRSTAMAVKLNCSADHGGRSLSSF